MNIICSICGEEFFKSFNLNRHILRKHQEQGLSLNSSVSMTSSNLIPISMHQAIMEAEKHLNRWKHPFTCIISGPTKAGKTEWVKKFVANIDNMMDQHPTKIYWVYSDWQPAYQNLDGVTFIEGLPQMAELKDDEPKLLILDDMMQEMKSNKNLVSLFTKGSHHWNLSCIHIVQNLFFNGLRTPRINAQYIVLMKNPADKLQISNLGRQIFPTNQKYFMESYHDACSKPYGYLVIDLTQETDDGLRLKTDVFLGELTSYYVPKK